jgi:outer membrane protein
MTRTRSKNIPHRAEHRRAWTAPAAALLAAALLPVLRAAAQVPAQPPPKPAARTALPQLRAAWVDLDRAIATSDEGKKRLDELQRIVDEKAASLERMRTDLAALNNKLKAGADKLKDADRNQVENQIVELQTRMQRFQQDSQADVDRRKNRIGALMTRKLRPVIEKVAKTRGVNAVFYTSGTLDGWIDARRNLTDDVVKAYNAANPASATPPAAAPGKTPRP